jgi:hypothetical protein
VILLDSDIILIAMRYPNDPKFSVNHQALQHIQAEQLAAGITLQALLEVVGILSFNITSAQAPTLAANIQAAYRLATFPNPQQYPDYASCTIQEIVVEMGRQMALGDAVQAVQIARYASFADCLLTWNAKHFVGKLVLPVLTPREWLQQQGVQTP